MRKVFKGRSLNSRYRSFDAFIYGMAHTFDFGGSLAYDRGRFGEGLYGDMKALRSDWEQGVAYYADSLADGKD